MIGIARMPAGLGKVIVGKKWLCHKSGTDAKVVARHHNPQVLVGQRVTLWLNIALCRNLTS